MKYKYRPVKNMLASLLICLFGIAAQAVDGEESKQPAPSELVQKIQRLMGELGLRIAYGTARSSSSLLAFGISEDLGDDMALFRFEKSLVEVLKAIKASGQDEVLMDCQLFVQIAAQIQQGKEHEEGFDVAMGSMPGEVMDRLRSAHFAYVTVGNEEAQSLLQKTILSSKGQWVIEDQGGWTGLLEDSSMATLSEEDWIKIRKQCFKKEISAFQFKRNLDPSQKILLAQISIGMIKGDFEEWIFSRSESRSSIAGHIPVPLRAAPMMMLSAPMRVASWGKMNEPAPNVPLELHMRFGGNKGEEPRAEQQGQSGPIIGYWANSDGGALNIAPPPQISPPASARQIPVQSQNRRQVDDDQLARDFMAEQLLLLELIERQKAGR